MPWVQGAFPWVPTISLRGDASPKEAKAPKIAEAGTQSVNQMYPESMEQKLKEIIAKAETELEKELEDCKARGQEEARARKAAEEELERTAKELADLKAVDSRAIPFAWQSERRDGGRGYRVTPAVRDTRYLWGSGTWH